MSKWVCSVTYTVDVEGCDLSRELTALIDADDILPDEDVERILREDNPTARLSRREWLVDERG